jgi:hypothetical protein
VHSKKLAFFGIKFVNICQYKYVAKKVPKAFSQKSEKICSQILRYFFWIYTIMITSHFFRIFSKAPKGSEKWTFINVQNGKPKVEFTFILLFKKRHKKRYTFST